VSTSDHHGAIIGLFVIGKGMGVNVDTAALSVMLPLLFTNICVTGRLTKQNPCGNAEASAIAADDPSSFGGSVFATFAVNDIAVGIAGMGIPFGCSSCACASAVPSKANSAAATAAALCKVCAMGLMVF
jgi:hypothetical protein